VAKKRDRKKVGEIIAKVRELGLSYKDGAEKFGIKPWVLYDYNRKGGRDAGQPPPAATSLQRRWSPLKADDGGGPIV
jgi:hypothetical protein